MVRAFVAALIALAPAMAGATFAPPEGSAWRYTIVQVRSDGATESRFSVERRVIFRRTDDGFVAELTLEKADGPQAASGAMFDRAMRALRGQTIRFRLDSAGAVRSIDDQVAIWAIIVDGIERAAGDRRADRSADARAMAMPLRNLPVEQQRLMLATMLAPVVAGTATDSIAGTRSVTVPLRTYLSDGIGVPGVETVTRTGTEMRIETHAAGDIAPTIPPGTPGADIAPPAALTAGHVRRTVVRRIDLVSGLVLDGSERSETSVGGGTGTSTLLVVTTITLRPLVL